MPAAHLAPDSLSQLRADTPGCADQIFLNNAGAGLPLRGVVERVLEHLHLEERAGGYEAEAAVAEERAGVGGSVAALRPARPDEIALTESATRSWEMAFFALNWQAGDVILTAPNEYASNFIAFLQVARRFGVRVVVVPFDATGGMDVAALAVALEREPRVRLIALTHVPTNNGRVQPAAEVGRLARQHGVPFLLDACQSAGQLPLDVEELGCDLLSATGRKYLRGPRGTGFLYVRRSILEQLEPTHVDMFAAEWTGPQSYRMRADARRFEQFESSVACRLGLGTAVRYALDLGVESIAARLNLLSGLLRQGLAAIPGVTVQDLGWQQGAPQCGIVTFTHERRNADPVAERLAEQRIVVRTSPRSSTLLDMQARQLDAVVRASVHYYNTKEELERFLHAVALLCPARTERSKQPSCVCWASAVPAAASVRRRRPGRWAVTTRRRGGH